MPSRRHSGGGGGYSPARRHSGGGGGYSPVSGRNRKHVSGGHRDRSRSRGEEDKRRHRKEKCRRSKDGRARRRDASGSASRKRVSEESEVASQHRKHRKGGEKRHHKSGKQKKDKEGGSEDESVDEFGRCRKRRRRSSGAGRVSLVEKERSRTEDNGASPCSPARDRSRGSNAQREEAGSAEASKSDGEGRAWEEWRAQPQTFAPGEPVPDIVSPTAIDEFLWEAKAQGERQARAQVEADSHQAAVPVQEPKPPQQDSKRPVRELKPLQQDSTRPVQELKPLQEMPLLQAFVPKAAKRLSERSAQPPAARPLLPLLPAGPQKEMAQLQWEDEDVLLKELCEVDKHVPEAHSWEKRGEGLLRILRHRKTGRARVIMQRMSEIRTVLNARLELAKFKVQGKHYVCFLATEKGMERMAYFRARFRFTPQQENFAALLQKLQDAKRAAKDAAATTAPEAPG